MAADEATSKTRPKAKKSMTGRILVGIGSGVLVGLFFGEAAGGLGVIGDVYVGLLQMTVLPFVVASLVANIGRFSIAEGRALAKVGSLALLLLFAVALAAVAVLPLAFPALDTGAFFSSSIIQSHERPDFFRLYIPSNPFYSLSQNLVPAAVLFSILLGVALTGLERKDDLLGVLDVVTEALGKVNGYVVRFTPIGVFAIAASAAGTLTVSEFGRLQAYLLTHTLGVVLMTFGVLPVLVSVLTPLRYGAILQASRDFLLTAWATGSLFVVLPMLIEAIEQLLQEADWSAKGSHANPEVLVPLAYPFPTVGKLLALVFVPFVAWFLGSPMTFDRYPMLLSAGLFSSFGNLVVTIPFLLDLMKLPRDFFNLFLMAGVWSARLGDLAGGMHLLAFTVLSMAGLSGRIRFQARRFVLLGTVLVAVTAGTILGTRALLAQTFAGSYSEVRAMESLFRSRPESRAPLLTAAGPNPRPLELDASRLDRIFERGAVRVGYEPSRFPFSFFNEQGHLVGFDIDLVRQFAADTEVELELVPFAEHTLLEQLEVDHFDIAVGSLWETLPRVRQMLFSDPYLTAHAALLVPDHRRTKLDTHAELIEEHGLEVAVVTGSYNAARARSLFPSKEIVELATEADFFERSDVDALLTTAEGGSAWTLVHPQYDVVIPLEPAPRVPLVIAIGGRDQALADYLNRWIEFRRDEGTLDEIFAHWIRGGALAPQGPRWSIGHDLLGWW